GRRVIRGIVAPPALPRVVRPFAADRAEHIAAEDEGAEAFRRGAGEAIVSPALFPDQRSKGPGRVGPTVQLLAPLAERILQAQVRAGLEAVDGHSKTRYAHLAHGGLHEFLHSMSLGGSDRPPARASAPRVRRPSGTRSLRFGPLRSLRRASLYGTRPSAWYSSPEWSSRDIPPPASLLAARAPRAATRPPRHRAA